MDSQKGNDDQQTFSPPERDAKAKTICLLGMTGAGKSATANTLLGDRENKLFGTSNRGESMTAHTSSKVGPWRGNGGLVRIVDTPGWMDSKGREVDASNRRDMGMELKKLEEVNAFLFLMNGQEPRFNGSAISLLKLLSSFFGKSFFEHLVIGFTRWDFDENAVMDREDENDMDESEIQARKAKELNDLLRDIFGHKFPDCSCLFIDNRLNFQTEQQLDRRFRRQLASAMKTLDDQLNKLWQVMAKKGFDCKGVSVLRSERAERIHDLVPHYLRLRQEDDAQELNRQLRRGDQDVLFSGWLWYRRAWIFGKLRRQSLRLYESDATNAASLSSFPDGVDLNHVVCNDYGKEQRRWISLIMDATQITDGCNRVQKLHDALTNAKHLEDYKAAVNNLEQQTIIVPVEWMHQRGRSTVLADASGQQEDNPDQSMKQLEKDFQREDIGFQGEEIIHSPGIENMCEKIAMRILDDCERSDETRMRSIAMALARDALYCCSRTLGGTAAFGAVETLFNNDLITRLDDQQQRCPTCLAEIKPQDTGGFCRNQECGTKLEQATIDVRVLQSTDAQVETVLDATGVPEVEGHGNLLLGAKTAKERSSLDITALRVAAAGRENWIPDDEWQTCMICGLPFSIFLRRRHHCRMCGKLICAACSQERMHFDKNDDKERSCFVCYGKTFLKKLHETATDMKVEHDEEGDIKDELSPSIIGDQPKEKLLCPDAPAVADVVDMNWPCVSVTMVQNFKICSNADCEIIFYLHCRYFRIVRWNGSEDTGRVFISIKQVQT